MMYAYLVFFHLAGLCAFLLVHGPSVALVFAVRRELDPQRLRAMLDRSRGAAPWSYGALAVLIGTGIALGYVGDAWGRGWLWLSIGLFVAVALAMIGLSYRYMGAVRRAVGLRPNEGSLAYDPLQLDQLRQSPVPVLMALIGGSGLLAVLWLMLFKPF
jgi:uncharacterized membrane protein